MEDVIGKRGKRRIIYATLLFCAAVFAFTLTPWASGSSPLHVAAQSSVFWLSCFILAGLGITEVLPMIPAVWKASQTLPPSDTAKS